MDLVVVGAGYWGVAAALVAERKGASVLLVDCARAGRASAAASAHFAFGWYKGPWLRRIRQAYEQAELFGVVLRKTGAVVNTSRHRNAGHLTAGRFRDDWYTFRPEGFLSLRKPNLADEVVALDSGWVRLGQNELQADRILVTAGVWTDELLARSQLPTLGVKGLRGTGAVYRHKPVTEGPVFLHEVTPYRQIAIREWGDGLIRVGETSEPPEGRLPDVQKMLDRVRPHLPEHAPVELLSGIRPLLADGPQVRAVAPGVVAATGGGRIGAMLAFWAAEEACKLLAIG